MINLRSLMNLLPYYFKEQDTYKVNGKGLLERYLDIFGSYFDDQVVSNINTLDDVIDLDKTPELYLGYIWEFLGSMPYANPKAIDPEKWKQYFNGFNDDQVMDSLGRLWLYRKDSDGDHYTLTSDQVRSLVKYSVALFSIRGTEKFFEILLRLYGFEVKKVSNTSEDDEDTDYWGMDDDYWGMDDDYFGMDDYQSSIDSLFDNKKEITKLDSEWSYLDTDTLDNHYNCTRIINVNFTLSSSDGYIYDVNSSEFKRLHDRLFNLINIFLPIGTRPHLIWDNVSVGDGYEPKVNRSIEVYVDRVPINWTSLDTVFVPSNEYPGWYRVYDRLVQLEVIPVRNFDWSPLKFMVKVVDGDNENPAFIRDQPKKFVVDFNNNTNTDFSDIEYEDGHIFTVKPCGDYIYYPKFKVSVICEDDFDLTDGSLNTFIIGKWMKYFNYTMFKHYNTSVDLELSPTNTYVPILIQSAFIRTYTNDANPDDDDFEPQQVINLTTGEYLTLCEEGTTLPDRSGSPVNYSQYSDRCMYVQHILEPGVYEFAILGKQEYRFTIEVKTVKEVLTLTLVEGSSDNIIDNENPTVSIKINVTSNLSFLGHEDRLLIKETTNPVTRYWNNGDTIVLDDPGHYRFYGVNPNNPNDVISDYVDINVLSNKYNACYYLELEDGDKSDDEAYMVRTLIANRPNPGATVAWSFDFIITVDKSVIEAQDILILDPNAFDLEVLLYKGGNPNRGILLGSWTATQEILTDDIGNTLPYYKVKGTVSVTWDGTYNIGDHAPFNFPPGLYCVELHDKNHLWNNSSSYRVIDAYVIPQKFDGNLYFDVDVISKAWTSPAGQAYDVDPITGKYTWGWFKTNEDYLHSVRLVRYDPAIATPQFRLKLTNNTIGYTRVYMYKLVENGNEWDNNAAYPKVLPPVIKSPTPHIGILNLHWLSEAIPNEWGFPGEYDDNNDVWDYGKGSTGVVGYPGRWLFTGTVYQLGEVITGPQEPGKYLFLVNQLEVDTKVINYAYLEVKEDIKYSLIVDPLLAILQGTAVGTKVDVISSSKFTNETLAVTVVPPNGVEIVKYNLLPYAFDAYQAGVYTFKLYKFEGGQWIYLGLSATFKVLTDNGIDDEPLDWEWSDTSDREVQVVTTSPDVDWTVKVQNG